MRTYKLFRIRHGKLYPLFVQTNRIMETGKWLFAEIGELLDEKYVRSPKLGKVALRPGFHSTEVPFTDWIGKKGPDGSLYQDPSTVWCECEVEGEQITVTERYGLRTIPNGWYYYKTRPRQPYPWIISDRIFIKRILDHEEVEKICAAHGIKAQPMYHVDRTGKRG